MRQRWRSSPPSSVLLMVLRAWSSTPPSRRWAPLFELGPILRWALRARLASSVACSGRRQAVSPDRSAARLLPMWVGPFLRVRGPSRPNLSAATASATPFLLLTRIIGGIEFWRGDHGCPARRDRLALTSADAFIDSPTRDHSGPVLLRASSTRRSSVHGGAGRGLRSEAP